MRAISATISHRTLSAITRQNWSARRRAGPMPDGLANSAAQIPKWSFGFQNGRNSSILGQRFMTTLSPHPPPTGRPRHRARQSGPRELSHRWRWPLAQPPSNLRSGETPQPYPPAGRWSQAMGYTLSPRISSRPGVGLTGNHIETGFVQHPEHTIGKLGLVGACSHHRDGLHRFQDALQISFRVRLIVIHAGHFVSSNGVAISAFNSCGARGSRKGLR